MSDNELAAVGSSAALRQWLESDTVAARILAVAGGDADAVKRMVAMACIAVAENDSLARCDKLSVLQSVMRSMNLGLSLGDPVRGEAYLVPFKGRCTLMLGYRGLQKLARRGGDIKEIYSHVVYKADRFEVRLGDNPGIDHIPDWRVPHRDENIVAFYAVAKWTHGGNEVCVMQRAEVDAIMEGVKRKNNGNLPDSWKYAYAETAKKSPLRRLCKQLPLTSEAEKIIHETEEEERIEVENVAPKNPLLAASERVKSLTIEESGAVAPAPVIDEVERALNQKLIDPAEIDAAADKPTSELWGKK